MKKLFSFFTLLAFIVIAFFQNSMMSFAMDEKIDMKMQMNAVDCLEEVDNDGCEHNCCYENKNFVTINVVNNNQENNKKSKIKINNFIDIFSFSAKLYENKKLTKITSPPNITREIKNYSYTYLTKIIKSNI